ncbi:MAG: RNase adapter protein RapZ [Solirubrobacteraceae bacterium]|nr:RNase adapter protein RapZ [Solirubrobacteraceae bacterium]
MSDSGDTLPDMATSAARRADPAPADAERPADVAAPADERGTEPLDERRVERPERPRMFADSRLEDLVFITGYSGAGKSTAMAVFEDAGYFCVDNLPPEMTRALVELFVHRGSKVVRAAIVSDVRGGDYFEAFRAVLDDLPGIGTVRKRTLLNHFGSPEAVVAATREQLEAVPGLPGKVARDLWSHLHRTGE